MPTSPPADGATTPVAPGNPASPSGADTLPSSTLDYPARYIREGAFGPTASPDFRMSYVGRDDVREKQILSSDAAQPRRIVARPDVRPTRIGDGLR